MEVTKDERSPGTRNRKQKGFIPAVPELGKCQKLVKIWDYAFFKELP